MRRQRVVLGVGLRPVAGATALLDAVAVCLSRIEPSDVAVIATLDSRLDHPALLALAAEYQCPATGISTERLAAQSVPNGSQLVADAVGTASVAEAAVIALGGELLLPKTAGDGVTVAIGRLADDRVPTLTTTLT